MDNPAVPFLGIIHKVAVVPSAIWPDLGTTTMTITARTELADIFLLGWKQNFFPTTCNPVSSAFKFLFAFLVVPLEFSKFSYFIIDNITLVILYELIIVLIIA